MTSRVRPVLTLSNLPLANSSGKGYLGWAMKAAADSPTFQLADMLLEGGLVRQLRAWREDGMSYERMAKELYVKTNYRVDVSGVTVNTWLNAED